jgi:hypothetical protein
LIMSSGKYKIALSTSPKRCSMGTECLSAAEVKPPQGGFCL